MFEQNHESKKSKQNLGMPEDNLKSIVQAFFSSDKGNAL